MKGFTLIELVGAIVILGIIGLITIPVIDKSLSSGKDNIYEVQVTQIKKGIKDYYAENLEEVNEILTNDGKYCKTISELQSAGNLELDIKNPKNNEYFDASTKVCIVCSLNDKGECNFKKFDYTVGE